MSFGVGRGAGWGTVAARRSYAHDSEQVRDNVVPALFKGEVMLSCVAISRSITLKETQLAQLAKRGQGHSLQAQELLDEVAQLELDYRNQGC